MKKSTIILLIVIAAVCQSHSQTTDRWQAEYLVKKQFAMYPNSTLQDLYKTCFQDVFGAEHLASDTQKVIQYIQYELSQPFYPCYPLYEYCGLNGNYVRVNISAVGNGYITDSLLASCFIRSSHAEKKVTLEQWAEIWHEISHYIHDIKPDIENFKQDDEYIFRLIDSGQYAWVHSRLYRDTYMPHYRIVTREIFENEIYPLLKR